MDEWMDRCLRPVNQKRRRKRNKVMILIVSVSAMSIMMQNMLMVLFISGATTLFSIQGKERGCRPESRCVDDERDLSSAANIMDTHARTHARMHAHYFCFIKNK